MSNARATRAGDAVEAAALELFVAKGFDGTSIEEIARLAKVSKPTIYAYYDGKESLFTSILERCCSRLLTPIFNDGSSDRPLADVLIDFALGYAETVLSKEVLALHRLFISEAVRFPELGQRYYAAGPQAVHDELTLFFQGRMADKQIVNCDPAMLAEQFAGLVLTPIRLRRLFSVTDDVDHATIEKYCRSAVDLFCRGACPPQ